MLLHYPLLGTGAIDWEMHLSDDGRPYYGRPYYYNSRTGDSTWALPPSMTMTTIAGITTVGLRHNCWLMPYLMGSDSPTLTRTPRTYMLLKLRSHALT